MLQPFVKFKEEYLAELKKTQNMYLVTQTYTRGFDHLHEIHPVDILLTVYDDPGLAKMHLKAILNDRYAYILNLTNEKHENKIKEMLNPASAYALYWAVVESNVDMKRILDRKYKDHIRRYLDGNTNWHISKDETIRPKLQIIFGELYISIKRGSQVVRVKFEEIENMKY